jgi:CheY-like chemotaxis protein
MGGTKRILVVDDEPNARGALGELLREEGYEVDTAADGLAALPKLAAFRPDVLLTDLRMPGMDGLELVARARAGAGRAPAVIFMSASRPTSPIDDDFLEKPVRLRSLLAAVERALAHAEVC